MKEQPPSSRPSPEQGETGVALAEDRVTVVRMLPQKFRGVGN
jgi:hypothetical protein